MSPFYELHGVYGQRVEVKTATLPPGWRARVIRFERDDTGDAHAFCLDPHDLVISKLIAGREKDLEFTQALLDAGLVEQQILDQRVSEMRVQRALDALAQQRLETTVEGFSRPSTRP